ncbi:MAG: hypothetical protein V7K67_27300 [Nostoc sp.]|uniref:hypothetical protein n=1 Tax=Nostoc sp. TaxID=1180 RepID=UPI002FF59E7B
MLIAQTCNQDISQPGLRVLSTFGDPVWRYSQLSDGASTRSLAIAKDEFSFSQ